MRKNEGSLIPVSRRDVLKMMGMGVVAPAFGSRFFGSTATATAASSRVTRVETADGPYNILFILTDQERYLRAGELPKDYRLPAHERLTKRGIFFENHRNN